MRNNNTDDLGEESVTVDRRSLLQGIGTAAVAGAGGVAASGSTAAWSHSDIDIIEVDSGWWSSWSADGDLPVVDELFIFIHGWFGDTSVESQAEDVLNSVEDGGFSPDAAVAIEWPASTINFFGAESDTEDVGDVVAGLIEDFYDSGGGNVRLTGHSLGGRAVSWVPTKLDDSYEIETVGALGAAADGSNICGGQWEAGIETNAADFRNYHSENDSTVGGAYGGWGDTALGTEGAGCSGPSGYTDVDVTSSVGDHFEFLGDSQVGEDLAVAINEDESDDEDDDDDDSCGWWWC